MAYNTGTIAADWLVPVEIRKQPHKSPLKPACVELGQKALNFSGGKASAQEVLTALDSLKQVLSSVSSPKHGLDAKVAEYVFFPLTHVFRNNQKLPSRNIEVALTCLNLLLQSGWRKDIPSDLAAQLLILLTVLAGGEIATKTTSLASEELHIVAFDSLTALFKAIENSIVSKKALIETTNIPALGHAVTVIIDGAVSGKSHLVQLSALDALQSLLECLPDREVRASFLPGIVSALTKVLTPNAAARRSFKVISQSLEMLSSFLISVLADEYVAPLLDSEPVEPSKDSDKQSVLSASWLRATVAQTKVALANVVQQRKHDRVEVRQALLNLCLSIAERCRKALAESIAMILETLIRLAQDKDMEGAEDKIKGLIVMDLNVAELIRESLYNWLISLPRLMQSNDDDAKRKAVGQVATALRLLSDVGIDMHIIDNVMTESLRDSVMNAIHIPKKLGDKAKPEGFEIGLQNLQLMPLQNVNFHLEFDTVLVGHKSGRDTILELQSLISQISTSESSMILARDLLDIARCNEGQSRLSSFWLSLNILRSNSSTLQLEDIMEFSDSFPLRTEMGEEMYGFCLSQLEDLEEDMNSNWQIRALSLEGLAFRASQLKEDFRNELIEALYPIVHLMGSRVSPLRDHAMTCLNIMALECGYINAKDLVISNVDYLVNAIGLKLSTFDISPQLPQVLQMMIKLCGPTLLPYLDDLVDSIFEALECFHGYPKLVEILFSVLQSMVEEGVKAPQLLITSEGEKSGPSLTQPTTVKELLLTLKEPPKSSVMPQTLSHELQGPSLPNKTPQQPWKDFNSRAPAPAPSHYDNDEQEDSAPNETTDEEKTTVLPKTYTLLQRITTLTQHHLPSSSTPLRLSLLSLLSTALPTLSMHQDAYLPLINTLWPVLFPRLADPEATVVAGVLDAMGLMCAGAGAFMVGRVADTWPEYTRIWRAVRNVLARSPSAAGRGAVAVTLPASSLSRIAAGASDEAPSRALVQRAGLTASALRTPLGALGPPSASAHAPYVPVPTRVLHAHLMLFLLRVVQHLGTGPGARLPWHLGVEAAQMLRLGLVLEARASGRSGGGWIGERFESDVREVLEAWNADALWLMDLRGYDERDKGVERELWMARLHGTGGVGLSRDEWVEVA